MCINILTITIKTKTCPRGEIGRHKGLKILALLGVPVRVWPRAPFKMNKLQIISDNNLKSKKIKKKLLEILKKQIIKKSNIVVVIGGDGFMLKILKKNNNKKKIFYGINSGNFGFLMNKFMRNSIIKNLNNAKVISIKPLEMRVISKKGVKKSFSYK